MNTLTLEKLPGLVIKFDNSRIEEMLKTHSYSLGRNKDKSIAALRVGMCKGRSIYRQEILSRIILDAQPGECVIYLDHDPLNLCDSNMKKVTLSEALLYNRSRSDKTGVFYLSRYKKYQVTLCHNYKNYMLGKYVDKQEALRVRAAGEHILFGKSHMTSMVPEEDYRPYLQQVRSKIEHLNEIKIHRTVRCSIEETKGV